MEISITAALVIVILLVVLAPIVLFRPLVNSIADRISGKRPGAKELSDLEKRVAMLEGEINEMRTKYAVLEDSQEFSRKLLEDMHKKEDAITPKAESELAPKSIEMDEVDI